MLIHVQNGLKQRFEIVVVKAGLCRQIGADKTPNFIETEGDQLFAAHGAQFILCGFRFQLEILLKLLSR